MKVGAFFLGGIVGAAAVVYLSSKSKSMLMSSFSSNSQSAGNQANKTGNSNRSGFGRVEEIIDKEPDLKAAVDEILRDNQPSEQYQTQ